MGTTFVSGLVTMGFLIAGLWFFRFWRRTGERLFAAFAGAFVLLAINQGMAELIALGREETGWVWLLRLAAFLLIIWAIVNKNLGSAE
jgi:zinc transporter ZupT